MDALLNYGLPPAHFYRDTYTIKEYLANFDNKRYKLPTIVNITSLNNYGRSIKNILTKHTVLLLIEIDQIDSVVAEYYGSHDGRGQSQRHRITLPQSKMVTKTSTKIRNMKKLSKSVASLAAANQPGDPPDDDYPDSDDENAYNLRAFMKLLNEKRSSSVYMCRIPTQYESFFELLNGNDQPIEPCHKLNDLLLIDCDENDPEKRTEISPSAFFLRSSCIAYTKKPTTDGNSNLTVSVDSCYGSSSDLDLPKNLITLNDNPEILQAGQTLIILGDCYALRPKTSDKEVKQYQSITTSSSYSSPTSWFKAKSKIFSKKSRQSNAAEKISGENIRRKSTCETFEHYVKCQTQSGDVIYISLEEPGLFSPLNRQTHCSKLKTRLNYIHTSDVFQLKDLLSNFRFPISVRLLDGPISFDNSYAPAVINRQDMSRLTPTKFRLLGSHSERVVFACPLNKVSVKSSKTSLQYIVLPLSVNADIQIQPCLNELDISRTFHFRKLMDACLQIIEQHQHEIALIHFPLLFTSKPTEDKEQLYKKRSQSESHVECYEEYKHKFRHSADQSNNTRRYSDELSSLTVSSLHNRESNETTKQNSALDTVRQQQSTNRHSSYHVKIPNDKKTRHWRDIEDEIYEDVDKIYDYIRTGDITDDVQKIQAKEQYCNSPDTPNSITIVSLFVNLIY